MGQKIETWQGKQERESTLRDNLQKIVCEVLARESLKVNCCVDEPSGRIGIGYAREQVRDTTGLNGDIEGQVRSTSFNNKLFAYDIKTRMNYFMKPYKECMHSELQAYSSSVSGRGVTKQQLIDSFRDYVSSIIVSHIRFFESLDENAKNSQGEK